MAIRVYRYRLRPPTDGQDLVREQIRAENRYRNDLCSIECGRRTSLRALEDTAEVRAAIGVLKASTRSDRKEAQRALVQARRQARELASECPQTERLNAAQACLAALALVSITSGLRPPKLVHAEAKREVRRARAEAGDRVAAIALLDEEIRANCYEHSPLSWGSKLTVHAAHDQFRRADMYDDDALSPRDPHYRRAGAMRYWPRHEWGYGDGQISVHIQNRVLTTEQAQSGEDAWVRFANGKLSLRVGSDGRRPIWATWPVFHSRDGSASGARAGWLRGRIGRDLRDLPTGHITWVRVRCSHSGPLGEGRGRGEMWECAITVDETVPTNRVPSPAPVRRLAALAVEVSWDKPRDDLVVARWRDSFGSAGSIALHSHIVGGLERASGIRSVRDTERLRAQTDVQRMIGESRDAKPLWLTQAAGTLHLWRSAERLHDLVRRWRGERCDAAREAYDRLQEWEARDAHLWAYEDGARSGALRRRLDFYRCLAKQWSESHETVIIDDRRLDREARFGEASELRFQAGPSELRGAIVYAFGDSRVRRAPWREEVSEEDDRDWCERAIGAHLAGSAREGRKPKRTVHGAGGAWASRLSGRMTQERLRETARKQARKDPE